MMHLLCKYDVATFDSNDAMFAIMCRKAHTIRRSRHHWQSQHHLPKANIIKKSTYKSKCFFLEASPRFELGVKELQSSALPLGYDAILNYMGLRYIYAYICKNFIAIASKSHYHNKIDGADYEARTRYLHLGKVALYQMS